MVAAIGGLARRGILVRGGSILQTGSKVDTVVFDKTGTLTSGRFRILKILTANGTSEDEVLALGATAESGSDHPLAKVIVETAQARKIAFDSSTEAHILPGRGAECRLHGRDIRVGNQAFLAGHGVSGFEPFLEEADRSGATAVLVAADNTLAGAILLRDSPRDGAAEAIRELEHLGLTHVILLTGDRRRAAEAIAREVGIANVEAELLPEQKLDRIRQLQSQGRIVAMIGDGVNDAPALAAADVGVAVAGSGADIAAEAADVVDLNRSLYKLPRLFEVSRRTVATIWQNIIVFAGIVNVLAVLAAGRGLLGPIGAAVVHQIASFLVMVNSVRLLKVERPRGRLAWWQRISTGLGFARRWRTAWTWLQRIDPAHGFAWVWERRRRLLKPALQTALALWVLSGIYILPPDETGVIERFGRKVLPHRQPGLHYKLPSPIERLTRIQARQARVLEIGFRTTSAPAFSEPPAFEWNVQHREGRFQPKPEEALMLTGDQNMVEMTAVVHYDLERPDDYLFQQADAEMTIRVAAESVLHALVNSTPLDDLLTTQRQALEQRAAAELEQRVERYQTGARVLLVKFQDVHPSVEVVDAFRDVAGALEEKNRLINEAEGYRNEQVALARGRAEARVLDAEAYRIGRATRAEGDAARFVLLESAWRRAPGPNASRLYLETMEQILPGRRKLILDSKAGGRRALYSIEDGVLVAPPGASMTQPPLPFQMPREEQ
jgi:Cu+-exporting ATPase